MRIPDLAEAKRTHVMEAFTNQGFTVHAESRHQTAAWFSSLPGDRLHNVHKSTHNTLTLAHLMPGLTAMWPGPERDEYLKGGPWFYAQTEFTSLFRVRQSSRGTWGSFSCSGRRAAAKVRWAISCGRSGCSTGTPRPRCLTWTGMPACSRISWAAPGMTWAIPACACNRCGTVRTPSGRRLLVQWLLDILELHHVR